MKQIRYSFWFACCLVFFFVLGQKWSDLSLSSWKFVFFCILLLGTLAVFYWHIEKRLLMLLYNTKHKRFSDIKLKKRSFVRKILAGPIWYLENAIYHIKKKQRHMISDLASEKDKLSNILLQISDGIVMLDKDNQIEYYNAAFLNIFSLDVRKKILGSHVEEVVFRPQFIEVLHTITKSISPYEQVIDFFCEGKKQYVQMAGLVFGKEGHEKTLIKFEDISKDKQIKKDKSTLLENLSHDLRTPLTVIQGHVDCLKDIPLKKEDNVTQLSFSVSKIERNVERLKVLCDQLLQASQLNSPQAKASAQYFEPHKMLESLQDDYRSLARQQNLQWQYDSQLEQQDIQIKGNELHFYQVLQNILDNAIKYTDQGQVHVIEKMNKGEYCLIIKDTGIGLSEYDKQHVFKRFYRADKTRSVQSGTGIGLSIVKTYLNQWAKDWNMQSKAMQGTEFTMCFATQNQKD